MLQHTGQASVPVVREGQEVVRGQRIARPDGFLSVALHAPASGVIRHIKLVPSIAGRMVPGIFLEPFPGSTQEAVEGLPCRWETASPSDILSAIQDAGIVGLGGAALPTHAKLTVPDGKSVDTLIVNGVECEPYLTSDHRVMVEQTEDIFTGVRYLLKVFVGGPMMGQAASSLHIAVTKGVSGVTAFTDAAAAATHQQVYPCIRCGYCVDACPVFLNRARRARAQWRLRSDGDGIPSAGLLRVRVLLVRLSGAPPPGPGVPCRQTRDPEAGGHRMTSLNRTLEIRTSPHLLSGYSVDTIMFNVVLALAPVTGFAVYAFGHCGRSSSTPVSPTTSCWPTSWASARSWVSRARSRRPPAWGAR